MTKVKEEDITKLYCDVYDIAAFLRTTPDQVFSWIREGDLLLGACKNKDNKIIIHKRILLEFLDEKGLLIKKPKPVRNVLVDY